MARPSSSSSRGPSSWWLLPAKSFASWQKYTSWWWRTSFFQTLLPPPLLSCIKNFQRQAKVFLKSILMHSAECQLLMDIRRIHNCMSMVLITKMKITKIWPTKLPGCLLYAKFKFLICERTSLVFLVINKAVWMTCRINDYEFHKCYPCHYRNERLQFQKS